MGTTRQSWQEQKVLDALRNGPITAQDALHFGCFRLAARIHDLRGRGFRIKSQLVVEDGCRYARYHLVADEQSHREEVNSV